MGLVTDDLTELLTEPKDETREKSLSDRHSRAKREPMQSGWDHAVCRLRKWLRTTLTAHGEHGDGLTR